MSAPGWRSPSFDFAAAPRNCSRSNEPTFGMSRSMMYLRKVMGFSRLGLLRSKKANGTANRTLHLFVFRDNLAVWNNTYAVSGLMLDKLSEMRAFQDVADAGGFSAA